jgi:hypothetical protein
MSPKSTSSDTRRPIRDIEQIASDIEQRRGGPLDMTDVEIGEMLEKAKHDVRDERNQRKGALPSEV